MAQDEITGAASATRDNLDAVASFSHKEAATVSSWQSAIERISAYCGSAAYFALVLAFILLWAGANLWAAKRGWRAFDAPPFPWLQGLVSSNALLLTIAVLIRQNRMVRLSAHHTHLDLQIKLLTEQKVTKVLQLVDELRRELASGTPNAEVAALTKPADPGAILEAVKVHLDSAPK